MALGEIGSDASSDGGFIAVQPEEEFQLPTTTSPNETGSESTNATTGGVNKFILAWHFQLIYVVAFFSMVVVAAGGNIIVVWVVVAHKRMRTVINYFLVNLAVADALISILNTLFNFVYFMNNDWLFGLEYCRFAQFIAPCTISASVFTFMAIAIDRYMAIIHPLKPRMGAGLVLTVIVLIWIVSFVIASPTLFCAETYTWVFKDGTTRTVCYLNWTDLENGVSPTDFAYSVFLMIANYFAPLSALVVTYTVIGLQLWGSQAIGERTAGQEETIRSKRRVVKMMIVIVVIFAVCWLPQHLYFIAVNLDSQIGTYKYTQHVYLIIYWFAMSNSMYNPIMYCWMNARFRNGFKYVFRWLPCITWNPNDALGIGGGAKIVRLGASEGNLGPGPLTSMTSTAAYRLPLRDGHVGRGGATSATQQSLLNHALTDSLDHISNSNSSCGGAGGQGGNGVGGVGGTGYRNAVGLQLLHPVTAGGGCGGGGSSAGGKIRNHNADRTGYSLQPINSRIREDSF